MRPHTIWGDSSVHFTPYLYMSPLSIRIIAKGMCSSMCKGDQLWGTKCTAKEETQESFSLEDSAVTPVLSACGSLVGRVLILWTRPPAFSKSSADSRTSDLLAVTASERSAVVIAGSGGAAVGSSLRVDQPKARTGNIPRASCTCWTYLLMILST